MNRRHSLDICVPCALCGARIGDPCTGLTVADYVHFVRRLDALLRERGATKEELYQAVETGTVVPDRRPKPS